MGDIALETMNDYRATIRELEEENKKLKENNNKLKELVKIPCTSYTRDLEKENKRLKYNNKLLEDLSDNQNKVISKIKVIIQIGKIAIIRVKD